MLKLPPETLPPAVVTDTAPLAAPGMTMPTRLVPLSDITMAVTPPIVKAVGLLRLVPVMVTTVPTAPVAGAKLLILGACGKAERLRERKEMKSVSFFIDGAFDLA
jgi:uncharacterized membrane protein HdeD (DUF308 family)